MLRAYAVTLPKPGKDPTTLANFRFISLLDSDVKIFAKLLAKRIMSVLPYLIKNDQMGFIAGHQTSDTTRRIINVIHYAEKTRMHWMQRRRSTGCTGSTCPWYYQSLVSQVVSCQLHTIFKSSYCTTHW